jgi:osmotically-inducible protein OsmY
MHTGDGKSRLRILLAVATGLLGLCVAGCGREISIDGVAASACDTMWAISTAFGTGEDDVFATDNANIADSNTLRSDFRLLINVKSALVGDWGLRALPIDVGVGRGIVTLYGEVDTPMQRARAEQIARNVPGVQVVQSGIAVIRCS